MRKSKMDETAIVTARIPAWMIEAADGYAREQTEGGHVEVSRTDVVRMALGEFLASKGLGPKGKSQKK